MIHVSWSTYNCNISYNTHNNTHHITQLNIEIKIISILFILFYSNIFIFIKIEIKTEIEIGIEIGITNMIGNEIETTSHHLDGDEGVGGHKEKEEDVIYPHSLYRLSTLHNPSSTPMVVDSF